MNKELKITQQIELIQSRVYVLSQPNNKFDTYHIVDDCSGFFFPTLMETGMQFFKVFGSILQFTNSVVTLFNNTMFNISDIGIIVKDGSNTVVLFPKTFSSANHTDELLRFTLLSFHYNNICVKMDVLKKTDPPKQRKLNIIEKFMLFSNDFCCLVDDEDSDGEWTVKVNGDKAYLFYNNNLTCVKVATDKKCELYYSEPAHHKIVKHISESYVLLKRYNNANITEKFNVKS